jgi:hypothetical protein
MRLLLAALFITAINASVVSHAAEQSMTRGLTNQRPDGTPGVTYQGGVAGYAGPQRDSETIGADVTPPEQARRNAENDKSRAESNRQRALEGRRSVALHRPVP